MTRRRRDKGNSNELLRLDSAKVALLFRKRKAESPFAVELIRV